MQEIYAIILGAAIFAGPVLVLAYIAVTLDKQNSE